MKKLAHILTPVCIAAAIVGAMPGCGEFSKDRKTTKQEQYDRWNAARVSIMVQLARQQFDAGDFEKCRQTLTQCVGIDPKHEPTYVLVGRLELESGDVEKSVEGLKTAIKLNAEDAEAYYYLGVCYQRWQNFQSAHENYKLAWDKKPTEPAYMMAMIEMEISLGQIDAAEKTLLDKLAFFEQTPAVRVALGRIQVLRGNYAKATQYYRDAILMSPDDIGLRQNYAEAIYMSGKYSTAIVVLEELARDPKVKEKNSILMLLGQSYAQVNRLREARMCFSDMTQANPGNTMAWFHLAKTYMQMKDYKQATGSVQRALTLEPQNIPAFMLLAACQQKMEEWAQARDTLAKATTFAPENPTLFCMLGICYDKLGDHAKAVESYRRATELKPDDPWANELLQGTRPQASIQGNVQ